MIDPVSKADAGTFACVAIAAFGQDTVEHAVQVLPRLPTPPNIAAAGGSLGCGAQSTTALAAIAPTVLSVRPNLAEGSAEVAWVLPSALNRSCFEAVSLSWWSNASDSEFMERRLSLADTTAVIDGLSADLGYYLQANLVAPLNVFHYGDTRAFTLHQVRREKDSS